MNDSIATPAVSPDAKTLIPIPPVKSDADAITTAVPTAANGNDEVMSQPVKKS